MSQPLSLLQPSSSQSGPVPQEPLIIPAGQVPNALLSRLIQEVQHEAKPTVNAYNRTHNRHNRGR